MSRESQPIRNQCHPNKIVKFTPFSEFIMDPGCKSSMDGWDHLDRKKVMPVVINQGTGGIVMFGETGFE